MSAVDGHDGEALPDRERAHPADRGAVPVRPAEGAGLEEMFLQLTADDAREPVQPSAPQAPTATPGAPR